MEVYRLHLEYNGKNFCGSQIQRDLRTVEKTLRDTLNSILEKYKLKLASRTDAGVHALDNVAKLEVYKKLEVKSFLDKLNYYLPDDLKVVKIVRVKKNFDVRKVKDKIYQYLIYNSATKPTLFKEYVWWVKDEISYSLLKKVAKFFSSIKRFDFATLKEVVDTKKNLNCKIKIKIKKFQRFFVLTFIGDRFLYKLIRNLVSLMVEVSTRKTDFEDLKKIVSSWKWFKGKPAPANALILVKINF